MIILVKIVVFTTKLKMLSQWLSSSDIKTYNDYFKSRIYITLEDLMRISLRALALVEILGLQVGWSWGTTLSTPEAYGHLDYIPFGD